MKKNKPSPNHPWRKDVYPSYKRRWTFLYFRDIEKRIANELKRGSHA